VLETEVRQGGSRVVLDEFVVEGASCGDFVGMYEVEKGFVRECFMVPAE
jgi:hypothetical protein